MAAIKVEVKDLDKVEKKRVRIERMTRKGREMTLAILKSRGQ